MIDVDNLRIKFGDREVVKGVSFSVEKGGSFGIVGESGSGKSTVGRALLRLLPSATITADRLDFDGLDLLSLSEKEMLKVRGRRMSMILQDPKFSLNPIRRVGDQVTETYLRHFKASKSEAREKALAMLDAVKIRDAARVYEQYPHEISGGMGQRVMIAMMLVAEPEMLIADEPTSALDVTVQLEVLGILDKLVAERGMGLIFVSHDLRLVSSFCDRVLVMYAGKVVEELSSANLKEAKHPYTQGLLNCLPEIGGHRHPLPVLERKAEWRA